MILHLILLSTLLHSIVYGYRWIGMTEEYPDKIILQNKDDGNLLQELNSFLETSYSDNADNLDLQNKILSDDSKMDVYDSEKTSHVPDSILTFNPFRSCLEKYIIDVKQLVSCVQNVGENLENNEVSKRRQGMLKLNAPGWKRKRRDTHQVLSRELTGQNEYRLNKLINRFLMRKRQKLRFNPSGW